MTNWLKMLAYDILWSLPLPKRLRHRIRHHIFMNAAMPLEDDGSGG